jgi:hypothetical protein
MSNFCQLDTYLTAHGVRFLPWIGNRYEFGFRGRRLLILGESHYPWEDEERNLADPLPPEVTRGCVHGVVIREPGLAAFGNTWSRPI